MAHGSKSRYSQKYNTGACSTWLHIINAVLLYSVISTAVPLAAANLTNSLLNVPNSSKHIANSPKRRNFVNESSFTNLMSVAALSGEPQTLAVEAKNNSASIPTSEGLVTSSISTLGSTKPGMIIMASSLVSSRSFQTKAPLEPRQTLVMTTSIPTITTVVVDGTFYSFSTRPATTPIASIAQNPTTNYASTIASPLSNGGRPPPSGDGYQYVSEDSKCGSKSLVRATCKGSSFGDCCSGAGFCGFDKGHCMDDCQTDFGTCGQAGIHPPISSDPATVRTPTTPGAQPTRTAVMIDQKIDYWIFKGCWTESNNSRALSSKTSANDSMTLDLCAAFCKGYQMFGAEYGRECYCGDILAADTMLAPVQQSCSFPCAGNKLQYCGGSDTLQLYTANSSAPTPFTVPGTSKNAGLGTYTGSQVIGMSIAGIVGLLFFIFLGKYRRPLLARFAKHKYRPTQPPSPTLPIQSMTYVTDLSSENTTPIKTSRQIPSSSRSITSSIYRFTDDLHITSGELVNAKPVEGWERQQLTPPENTKKIPVEDVMVLKASEVFKKAAFRGVGSGSSPGAFAAMNKRSLEVGMVAASVEGVEQEAERIRQDRIRHALAPGKGADVDSVEGIPDMKLDSLTKEICLTIHTLRGW